MKNGIQSEKLFLKTIYLCVSNISKTRINKKKKKNKNSESNASSLIENPFNVMAMNK